MRFEDLRDLVDVDRNMGQVYPPRPIHRLPDKGARFHGLSALKDFIRRLTFQRTIANDESQAFKVPADKIKIYGPDEAQEDQKVTGVGIVPGPYSYDEKWVYSLGRPEEDDNTVDVYGRGTALITLGYYVEQITIESVAAAYPTVRGINEGIRYAIRFFTDSGQLYLKCPKYFDQEACFSITSGAGYATDFVFESQGRRLAHLQVEFWIPEVALIDVKTLRPVMDYGPNDENIRDGNVYATLE